MPFFFLAQDITDTTVSVSTSVGQILTWIVIGLVAGFAASLVVRGRTSSPWTLMVIGILGGILGGFLFEFLGAEPTGILGGEIVIRWMDIVAAFVGALLIFLVASMFYRRR